MASKGYTDPVQQTTSPLQPRNSPVTFMSFSREIRDDIYSLTLVSPSPIIVWKGEYAHEPEDPKAWLSYDIYHTDFASFLKLHPYVWRQVIDQVATKTSLNSLSPNLLLCNKITSQEVAKAFYTKNTFSFIGDHNWDRSRR